MTHPGDAERIDSRAVLLPEEREFAVQDPQLLAAAVLADSDERTADADERPADPETGAQTSPPVGDR